MNAWDMGSPLSVVSLLKTLQLPQTYATRLCLSVKYEVLQNTETDWQKFGNTYSKFEFSHGVRRTHLIPQQQQERLQI